MKSIILKTASNYLLPLLLLFSVFVLLRGHYLPGGGFVGGLIASIAFVLHAFAHGLKTTQKFLAYHPGILIPTGLSISFLSALFPLFRKNAFMQGTWLAKPLPVIGNMGTPFLFDVGVYFVVIGVTLTILFTIAEANQ
jgi:multicomponent Na+:H+ antiporter subunit B